MRNALGSGLLSRSGDTSASADLIIPANCGRVAKLEFQTRTSGQTWNDVTAWSPISQDDLPIADSSKPRVLSATLVRFRIAAPVAPKTLLLRVRALSGQTAGPPSDAARIFIGQVDAPTGLRAVAGQGSVSLSWSPQPGRGITSWQYQYRSTGDYSAPVKVSASSVTTVVGGLTNNTQYTFRLRSTFGHQSTDSAWSQVVFATPTATPPGVTLSEAGLTVAEGGSSRLHDYAGRAACG